MANGSVSDTKKQMAYLNFGKLWNSKSEKMLMTGKLDKRLIPDKAAITALSEAILAGEVAILVRENKDATPENRWPHAEITLVLYPEDRQNGSALRVAKKAA